MLLKQESELTKSLSIILTKIVMLTCSLFVGCRMQPVHTQRRSGFLNTAHRKLNSNLFTNIYQYANRVTKYKNGGIHE